MASNTYRQVKCYLFNGFPKKPKGDCMLHLAWSSDLESRGTYERGLFMRVSKNAEVHGGIYPGRSGTNAETRRKHSAPSRSAKSTCTGGSKRCGTSHLGTIQNVLNLFRSLSLSLSLSLFFFFGSQSVQNHSAVVTNTCLLQRKWHVWC